MKNKTTRDIGRQAEESFVEKLRVIEPNCRPTKNSGASTELGDILSQYFLVEMKKRNTKDITIREDIWQKLLLLLPVDTTRIPLYVLQNVNNKTWICLDMNDFFNIVYKAYKNEE